MTYTPTDHELRMIYSHDYNLNVNAAGLRAVFNAGLRLLPAEDLSNNEIVTVDEIAQVRVELEKATDYDLVKQIAYRALHLLERLTKESSDV